jgi:hypothetical protein
VRISGGVELNNPILSLLRTCDTNAEFLRRRAARPPIRRQCRWRPARQHRPGTRGGRHRRRRRGPLEERGGRREWGGERLRASGSGWRAMGPLLVGPSLARPPAHEAPDHTQRSSHLTLKNRSTAAAACPQSARAKSGATARLAWCTHEALIVWDDDDGPPSTPPPPPPSFVKCAVRTSGIKPTRGALKGEGMLTSVQGLSRRAHIAALLVCLGADAVQS